MHSPQLLRSLFTFLMNGTSGLISVNGVIGCFGDRNQGANCSTITTCVNCVRSSFLTCHYRHFSLHKGRVLSNATGCCVGSLIFGGFLCPKATCKINCGLRGLICLRLLETNCSICAKYTGRGRISFVTQGNSHAVCLRSACVLMCRRTIHHRCTSLRSVRSGCRGLIISLSSFYLPSRRKVERIQT